jgi:hypothetical protein
MVMLASAAAGPVAAKPLGTIHSVEGEVEFRAPGGGWQRARPGMPIPRNSNLRTMDGSAEIVLQDGTRVHLAPDSLLVMYGEGRSRLSRNPAEIEMDEAELKRGLAALRGQ